MDGNQPTFFPRKLTVFNITLAVLLVLLVLTALLGIDLQHAFIRAIWPVVNHDKATEVSLHFTAPAKSIAEVPLNTPLFGWPACLILLATLGTRHRYRRITPTLLFTLVSLFGYFVIVFTHDTLLQTNGTTLRWLPKSRSLLHMLAITGCNLALAFIAWRWTRSRVMLCGLLALAMFSPLQHVAERELFYFSRLTNMPSHGGPSREIPSQFERWLGPNLSDTWAAASIQRTLSGNGPLYKSIPVTITTETYLDNSTNGPVTKSYPDVVVFINYIFGIGYNAVVLLLALWVALFNRRDRLGQCIACDYDLTGLSENTPCPECGCHQGSTIRDAQ